MKKSYILRAIHNLYRCTINRTFSYKSIRRPDVASTRKKTAPTFENRDLLDNERIPSLSKQLKARILSCGPITVADYMREVLTNPTAGYYMHRDVFGKEGDFVTSPEISQIFGELVGIWIFMEWCKLGNPVPLQIVELGPGRGTLVRDVLRVLTQLKLAGNFSIHLVEISPYLSKLQAQRFCFNYKLTEGDESPHYLEGETATGTKAYWYKHLEDVPKGFSVFLAHEFFDALPIHKLQFDDGVWKEILIDVNFGDSGNANDFRFVMSKAQTPISKLYQPFANEIRQCLEYSPETERIIRLLIERLNVDGGICLIMDYGHNGEKSDTFRAFKKHHLHDPLVDPGTADLTADVDFKQLKRIAEENGSVICFGPEEQGVFLKRMEGDARLKKLLEYALPENQKQIRSAYEMLIAPDKMGKRFKFFSMFPAVVARHLEKFPVHGFY